MRLPPIPRPPHAGGCLCGAVRYRIDAAPLATVACHCRDCQKLTGATNLLTVYFDSAAFRHERGAIATWRKRADSGREADYFRCANCGTRLWHQPLSTPQWIMVAAGTLDEPGWVVPAAHIWLSRAVPSAYVPEHAARWAKGPADRSELIAAFAAAQESAGHD
ncbi:MAG TPA: GFA family protein [Steroidobacteraceae bacterium]|nr:GFA family protein [Steroidobacteraceae bacterium]